MRRIIKINEDLYNGHDACADTCHEGATVTVGGKARPIKDDCCGGLGDCLSTCPTGAITFKEREATAYDEAVTKARVHQSQNLSPSDASPHRERPGNHLTQWPAQTKLAPAQVPYFKDACLLIIVDCIAFACGNFHNDLIAGRVTLIGCPKPGMVDYSEKLTEIIRLSDIRDVTIARMEVPCCGGIESAARRALRTSGKFIPWQVMTMRTDESLVWN